MKGELALPRAAALARGLDWLAPALVTLLAALVFLNGAFFSSFSAPHVDLSINFTAAHAIADGQDPYGETTLLERARELGSPPDLGKPEPLIYRSLFTSYIQPPPSAVLDLPLTLLPWREATRLYLILNNLMLGAAVSLMLVTVKPTVPLRWAVAAAALLAALFSQVATSFALGQLDALITLLLAVGLWGYSRSRPAATGVAVAAAAALKLVPGVLLLYFLWKREYRTALWTLAAGAAIFLVTLAIAGPGTYWTYVSETVPALMKGSTHYTNISMGGVFNRLFIKDLGVLGPLMSLDEVPSEPAARALALGASLGLIGVLAAVVGRGPVRGGRAEARCVLEYYLAVAAGLLVSSVTWEFYVIWLLPLYVAVFTAPDRLLPRGPMPLTALLAGFGVAFVAMNYPGGRIAREYLFDRNSFFYHPEWVPGVWVEEHVFALYGGHLTLVPLLRLSALALLVGLLCWCLLTARRLPGAVRSAGS